MARTRDRAPVAPKPKSDVYVGMLALALIAQIAGAAFLWLDYSEYRTTKPPKPAERPVAKQSDAGGAGKDKPAGVDKDKDKDKDK